MPKSVLEPTKETKEVKDPTSDLVSMGDVSVRTPSGAAPSE